MENSTQQNKKYYNEITIAKGIGILLVVLGHALKQTGVSNVPGNALTVLIIYDYKCMKLIKLILVNYSFLDYLNNII